MEKFEIQKKITEMSEKIQSKEIGELEAKKTQLLKQLEEVDILINMKKRSVAGAKESIEEESKFEEVEEKIGKWKEGQKAQAKEALKKFFEREAAEKREVLINRPEQEKLIDESLLELEAAELLKESPARADLELAAQKTREELKKPKELEIVEIKFFEGNELPEKVESGLLADSKRLEASADRLFKFCQETKKQLLEKGIDVDKLEELSAKEKMKLFIKSLFDKKLGNLYKSYRNAYIAAMENREEAWSKKIAATNPKEYNKLAMNEATEVALKKYGERHRRLGEAKSLPPPIWVKRV